MSIDTTLNMKADIRSALDEASVVTGKSRSLIIVMLMRRLANDYRELTRLYQRIQYQEREEGTNWRGTHVRLMARDYEVFLDFRLFFKRSVSFLVACAVERYLDALIKIILYGDDDSDNNLSANYIIAQNKINDIVCWHIYWGIPPRRELARLTTPS